MNLHLKLLVLLLFVFGGMLEAQRAVSDTDYGRASTGEAGLMAVIDQVGPVIGCGKPVLLTATITGASEISWRRNGDFIDGATTSEFIANQSGIYSVLVISSLCQFESEPVEVILQSPLNAIIISPQGTQGCEGEGVELVASGGDAQWQWYLNGEPIFNSNAALLDAQQSGAYTLVGDQGLPCESVSDPVEVIINPLPQASLVWNGNPVVCAGDSLEVLSTAQNGQTLFWYHDESPVLGASGFSLWADDPGEYHAVIEQTATGCTGITNSVFLEWFPEQVVTITAGGPTSFCGGAQTLLAVSEGEGTVQWIYNGLPVDTAVSLVYSVFESGVYQARLTDGNGCTTPSNEIEVFLLPLPDGMLNFSSPNVALCGLSDTLLVSASDNYDITWYFNGEPLLDEQEQQLEITQPGLYSAEMTNDSGCRALTPVYDVEQFDVEQPLLEPSGSINICEGQFQLFEVFSSGGLLYSWYNNGVLYSSDIAGFIEVFESGSWSVEVTYENGCVLGSETSVLEILEVSQPVITSGGVTSEGNLLIAGEASGHQWYLNGNIIEGATGAEYLAIEDGDYTVIAIEDVCESPLSESYEVVLGSVASTQFEGVSVYPNPCSDAIKVMFGGGQGSLFKVYDASGGLVFTGVVCGVKMIIDVQSWSSGVYSLVTDRGGCLSFMVMR